MPYDSSIEETAKTLALWSGFVWDDLPEKKIFGHSKASFLKRARRVEEKIQKINKEHDKIRSILFKNEQV